MKELYVDQEYPIIGSLDEFEKNIEDMEEIGNFKGDGYKGFQYNVTFPETFLTAHARETRGIVFDTNTGRILRRPYSKYFNVNEKEHTQLKDLVDDEVLWVSDKLDGTLISPFKFPPDDSIFWGTKRCAKDFHEAVIRYLMTLSKEDRDDYEDFVRHCIAFDISPLFEFHDPETEGTVIVLQYGKPFLKLIGMRSMTSGKYIDIRNVRGMIYDNFPAVQMVTFREETSLQSIKDELELLEGEEGRVIMLRKNGLVKMKCPWYCKRHNIKSMFGCAHIKAQLIFGIHETAEIDDISPDMTIDDIAQYEEFANKIKFEVKQLADYIYRISTHYETKKEYGLAIKAGTKFDNLVFNLIENGTEKKAYDIAVKSIKDNIQKRIRFAEWREEVKYLYEN